MKIAKYLFFILIYSISFSQENSTDKQIDDCLQNSLNDFLQNDSFKNIKKNLVISSLTRNKEIIIRIIPLINDFNKYNELTSNYKSYFDYNGFNILYYENTFALNNDENVVLENVINEENESEIEIIKFNNPEYYGMEFIYINNELYWKEESYFGRIIINQFPTEKFYNDVILR